MIYQVEIKRAVVESEAPHLYHSRSGISLFPFFLFQASFFLVRETKNPPGVEDDTI